MRTESHVFLPLKRIKRHPAFPKIQIMEKLLSMGFIFLTSFGMSLQLHGQTAPTLGTVADFVLFSTNGSVSNNGISQITGNVGTNNGSSTAFGNVNGVMHDNNIVSALCAMDLLGAYNQLDATIPTDFPAPLLGNGQILTPGVFAISGSATLDNALTLDGQNDPNALFIFQVDGAFSSGAGSQVILTNGAKACNVFWKVEGLVSLASGTTMRGTLIANNSAVIIYTGTTLEGRALSTAGAVTVDGILAYTPVGCGSPVLTGPQAPDLLSTSCYAVFSSSGAVGNNGISFITGDVGTNVGLTTGFSAINVTGMIHPIPDASTAACSADLNTVYNNLNLMPYDIELLYPADFGNNLVLTPHTYRLNGATTFTDTLFLNAMGNANAVFVIQANGSFATSTYSRVVLMNGTQASNVFWKIEGALDINGFSDAQGTFVCNNAAINIQAGTTLDGRVLTTSGAISTSAMAATIPSSCTPVSIAAPALPEPKATVSFFPNPWSNTLNVRIPEQHAGYGSKVLVYNAMGVEVIRLSLNEANTRLETMLADGMYFYKYIAKNGTVLTGRLDCIH